MKLTATFPTARRLAWLACFVLVFVSAFSLSGRERSRLELDPSWNAVIEHAALHHWQFGTQIVFTFGPLGFLSAPSSVGQLVGIRIAFALFWGAVVALTALTLAWRMGPWVRYAFLAWLILFTLSEGLDQTAFWVLASGTLLLLIETPQPRWRAPLFVATFSILALIKTSFFTAGIVSLAVVLAGWIHQRKTARAVKLATAALLTFVAGWIACGQSVSHLGAWIGTGLELESGYSGAMNLTPGTAVLAAALAALVVFTCALIAMAVRGRKKFSTWLVAATLAQYTFLAWKEGFTRCGDWHAFVFIWFLPLGLGFFLLDGMPDATTPSRRWTLNAAYAAGIVLCLIAAHYQIPGFAWRQAAAWPRRLARNAAALARVVTGRSAVIYAESRDSSRDQMLLLDHAQDVVGRESVDVMNYLQFAAIANKMNYQPRPVFQGFVAYAPTLQQLNAEYFQGTGRPRFILLCQQATDGRFPAQEDSAALNYVLNNYVPVGRDGRFLILRQQTAEEPNLQLVQEQTAGFGERIDLVPWAHQPLFLSVEITASLLGRTVTALYQQQPLSIRVSRNHEAVRYRIVPSMALHPFLINPVPDGNFDVMNLYTSQPGKDVESFVIEQPEGGGVEFKDAIHVRLYTAPTFPLAAKRVSASRIIADVQGRVFWPLPALVESATPARLTVLHGSSALRVSAPSKIVVNVPDKATSFSGYFGLPEEPDRDDSRGGEIAISIVVQDQDGSTTWRLDRTLKPSSHADDRGRVAFSVPIDGRRDRTVTLVTGSPAPRTQGWSVWSMCRFEDEGAR